MKLFLTNGAIIEEKKEPSKLDVAALESNVQEHLEQTVSPVMRHISRQQCDDIEDLNDYEVSWIDKSLLTKVSIMLLIIMVVFLAWPLTEGSPTITLKQLSREKTNPVNYNSSSYQFDKPGISFSFPITYMMERNSRWPVTIHEITVETQVGGMLAGFMQIAKPHNITAPKAIMKIYPRAFLSGPFADLCKRDKVHFSFRVRTNLYLDQLEIVSHSDYFTVCCSETCTKPHDHNGKLVHLVGLDHDHKVMPATYAKWNKDDLHPFV